MSGILNKKQRIMDFSLTRNGYEQTQNGDLRIKYATFTDKDAIYDIAENTIDIADISSMPFHFEAFNTYLDDVSPEIDINSYVLDSDINNNIRLTTDYDKSYIRVNNGQIIVSSSLVDISPIFSNVVNSISLNFEKQSILLTDNIFNSDFTYSLDTKPDIGLKVYTVNNTQVNSSIDETIHLNSKDYDINFQEYYTISQDSIIINDKNMLNDSRFINKLSYKFLPPSNMKIDAVTKNNKILNFYNLNEDNRSIENILVKKNINLDGIMNIENVADAASNLEKISLIKKEGTEDIEILNFELEFEKIEKDSPFILQLYESNQSSINTINKLLCIDHGEIFSKEKNRYIQVFSFGKLFHTNTDVSFLFSENNNSFNENYINFDNYLFTNLFTMVLE